MSPNIFLFFKKNKKMNKLTNLISRFYLAKERGMSQREYQA